MPNISQAKSSQTSKISHFLDHASLVHRHLDWTSLLDWIEVPPFLLNSEEDQIIGILACPIDPDMVSWIKCFACEGSGKANDLFASLLLKAKTILPRQVDFIYALGLQDWFVSLLEENNFRFFQDVVTLTLTNLSFNSAHSKNVFVRPMELSDLSAVSKVDHQSFEPIWTISAKGLNAAFLQSAHASVAESDGEIVGYELSTANDFSAHLARVAVLPEFQHAQIGLQLVHEMVIHFVQKNVSSITVNTQSNNIASLNLYKKVGFIKTGDRFPVFRTSI